MLVCRPDVSERRRPPLPAGGLVGAMVGLSGIPQRFVDGLSGGAELVKLAAQLAAQAFPES